MAYSGYFGARKVVVERYICEETGHSAYECEVFSCSPILPIFYECGIESFTKALAIAKENALLDT